MSCKNTENDPEEAIQKAVAVIPINRLPNDTLAEIFELLAPEDQTLCTMSSFRWRETIKYLWPDLNTTPGDILITSERRFIK